MATQFPNKTAQQGVYKTGVPDYIDVSDDTEVVSECVSFAASASAYGVADGDTFGLLIRKDASNWKVWTATWDATNSYLRLSVEEATSGTIANNDAVTVYATMTTGLTQLVSTIPSRMQPIVETTTSRILSANDSGKTICCTNGATTAIALPDNLPVNVHGLVVQEGIGEVRLVVGGTSTINGGTAPVLVAGQFKSAYFYQRTVGTWVVCA